ncbi:hypothetical protein P153DRAFT_336153 [Dothidotthia symphoricarpi CBS 119687]|uniref:G-patch domain-containing protein n=1 Tax=Dothidotthia symphoricarpi CBS 119687 TaxID=1392245 RepID=A0A6A6AJB2_9PLEO|nr:uncharacterized protein P153DRAFT_336153 [Dothidotthia symphoricarpi CBS 119687]KAF2131656.1 hypothetical protein P153DRAFT_336153 [Dothidotthia symphoricarpi CBS 119687]
MTTPTPNPRDEYDEDDPRRDDADISTAPFVDQPAYGRGLWKRPVSFVSATSTLPTSTTKPTPDGRTMAEKYLAIMFPNGQPQPRPEAFPLCGICGEPVKESDPRIHYLSPAHQAVLPRAPIPSSIDRTRMGLKYLQNYGFDVDARVGLGASGQGMLFPLVPKEKRDRLGLGIEKKGGDGSRGTGDTAAAQVKDLKLGAGKIRKLAKVEKKRHEKLQKMFYGNDEVEKYLGLLDG